MSPASQGALEVERYIGSCLISSGCCKDQPPPQQQQHNRAKQFWAGGAPLVQPGNRVPLSRLAVHTQGAPLILSSQRYHNNAARQQPKPPLFNNISRQPLPPPLVQPQRIINNNNNNNNNQVELKKPASAKVAEAGGGTNIDSLSVASDESSGSNNSENSLPRIIKPRKRRKKDRKPPLVQQQPPKDGKLPVEEPIAAAPVVPQPQPEPRLRPYSYDNNPPPPPQPRYDNNYYRRGSINGRAQEVVDTRQQQQQQQQQQQRFANHRHVQVKVLDDNRNVILQPLCPKSAAGYLRQPSARFISESLDDECGGALCQCRYCDPATLVWDVSADQASFPAQYLAQAAPMVDHRHHHHHHHRYAQVPVFLTARPIICPAAAAERVEFDNPCLQRLRQADGNAALLRRNWSDPTSYFGGDEIPTPHRDVGVIGDRGGQEKSKNPWRGDALSCGSSSPASPTNSSDDGNGSGPLRVSTEIVTSPNGHRDLEIKFYSTSQSGAQEATTKSAFAFPATDDDADSEFSDIWSYHESKLQQDFRTLLQAGED